MQSPIATIGYPEKFHLALKYSEGPLKDNLSLSDSDRLLLYALEHQAQHGPCREPRPSFFADGKVKAKHNAWRELGERSQAEAMYMFVTAIDEFAPGWWEWPELGLASELEEPEVSTPQPATPPTLPGPSSPIASLGAGGAESDHDSDDEADADSELVASLNARLASRSPPPPPSSPAATEDARLVCALSERLRMLLAAKLRQRNVPALRATLHSLACLAAIGGDARRQCSESTAGCVELAMRVSRPSFASELELPTVLQHLALMILVNISVDAHGAQRVSAIHLEPLRMLAEHAEDPRSRSLAHAALDNVAQHGSVWHHLTRRAPPGRLQLASPASMLRTFARLERSCHSAPPPCTPGNRRLPTAMHAEADEEAAIEAAVEAAAEAAEAAAAAADAAAADANGHACRCNGGSSAQDAGASSPPATAPQTPPLQSGSELRLDPGLTFGRPSQTPSQAPLPAWAIEALQGIRAVADELHQLLRLKKLARATAPWGAGKFGVVLSSLGSALQHARQSRHGHAVAALAHDAGVVHKLFPLLRTARVFADHAGLEGCLWCLAALAHLCGGRILRLSHHPEHEDLLFESLSDPSTPVVLLALSSLRAAAADPLSVRRVARHLKLVHEKLRSADADVVKLACAVIANVEQYSHARLWYAKSHSEAAQLLEAPMPPPPPPLVLYSQPPTPPASILSPGRDNVADQDFVDCDADAVGDDADDCHGSDEPLHADVLCVPRLACQLHPWVSPALRRAACVRLASALMGAWHRGKHDAVLLYLLEASLVPRRLGFALSREMPSDDPLRCVACASTDRIARARAHRPHTGSPCSQPSESP
jgi:acyl-CoA-binding protein